MCKRTEEEKLVLRVKKRFFAEQMELILSNAFQRLTNTWGKKENLSENFQNVSFSVRRCRFLPGRIFNGMDEAVRVHSRRKDEPNHLGWKCRRFLFGAVFAHICIWKVFGFYSSEDARIIHTPRQTGNNTKRFTHSWQPANVQEQTHTQNQTSKINRQQAFCITFLLQKKINLYPVWIYKDNFELFWVYEFSSRLYFGAAHL